MIVLAESAVSYSTTEAGERGVREHDGGVLEVVEGLVPREPTVVLRVASDEHP